MEDHNTQLIRLLPQSCSHIGILPRHRTRLEVVKPSEASPFFWVVLLTIMPNQSAKAWKLEPPEYYRIQPKHETRARWVREHLPPTFEVKPVDQNSGRLF